MFRFGATVAKWGMYVHIKSRLVVFRQLERRLSYPGRRGERADVAGLGAEIVADLRPDRELNRE
jgi:hypothetical protein